jgi:hypothetical protein
MAGTRKKQEKPKPPKAPARPKPPSVENDDLYNQGDMCTPEPERDDEELQR